MAMLHVGGGVTGQVGGWPGQVAWGARQLRGVGAPG